MSCERIDAEVIEVAARARHEVKASDEGLPFKWHEMPAWHQEAQMKFEEAAIRAADQARGLRKESREPPAGTSIEFHEQQRFVSDWWLEGLS